MLAQAQPMQVLLAQKILVLNLQAQNQQLAKIVQQNLVDHLARNLAVQLALNLAVRQVRKIAKNNFSNKIKSL